MKMSLRMRNRISFYLKLVLTFQYIILHICDLTTDLIVYLQKLLSLADGLLTRGGEKIFFLVCLQWQSLLIS